MRVIGGSAGGRRLTVPKGSRIRPTADRVKEALFSALLSRYGSLQDFTVLDLFSGTGSLGIEALSRGASRAIFIDNHPQSQQIIRKNLELTGFTDRAQLISLDALKALHHLKGDKRKFDIIFIDPPYQEEGLMHRILEYFTIDRFTTPDGLIVFETGSKTVLSLPDELYLLDRRLYGDTAIHYISHEE